MMNLKRISGFISALTLFSVTSATAATAGDGSLSLRDLTEGTYAAKRLGGITPAADGQSYLTLSADGKRIESHSFRTGALTATVADVAKMKGSRIDRLDGFILSPDGKNLLLQTNTRRIYRRSFTADYYIYSLRNNTATPLSAGGAQQAPQFSPDGTMIAFVRQNNLFLVKLLFDNSESQVTTDGKQNCVLNGTPDWVNEEEFSTSQSYCFTADSKMLAWIRYDESRVRTFSFPLYKGLSPERKEYAPYPGRYEYKYPVAGEQNSKVSLHSFDIKSHATRTLQVPVDSDGYVPRLLPTSQPDRVVAVTLNRHQNRMCLYAVNTRSTVSHLILREENDRYLRESAYEDLRFYGNNFVMRSDRSGFDQLYWYDMSGRLIRRITSGDCDVTDFYGYDTKTGRFFYASRQEGPQFKAVFSTDLRGNTRKLSQRRGTNTAQFSADMKLFANTFSDASTPYVTTLCTAEGKTLATLIDNADVKTRLGSATKATKEFFSFTTSEGVKLNGYMVKPAGFDASRRYPVVMYQYSGPGSQEVVDSWNIGFMGGGAIFESYLAQEGFIAVCVDGRGTGGRGSQFEKQIYLRMGDLESRDQVETALYLGSLPYVDKDNIAIWGWSFGGFNTLMSMTDGRGVFKAGVAVAPPTDWRFYDTVYTERYMRTPQENADGYDINPIQRAGKLSGNLLLIHATADDNVHFSNTAEFSEALVQAGKQFDMQVYTNRNHSIYGGNTRNHLLTRIVDFLKQQLQGK